MSYAISLPNSFSPGWFSEPTQTTSDCSRISETATRDERDRLAATETFGQVRHALYQLYQDCSQPGWDGYGAFPVSADTLELAIRVLNSLSPDFPKPSFGAEPDGQLTMEWYRSPHRVLSVSISPLGVLYYAVTIGAEQNYGHMPFLGQFPDTLREWIRKVNRA